MMNKAIACLTIATLPVLAQAQAIKLTPWAQKGSQGGEYLLIEEKDLGANTCASKPAGAKLVVQKQLPRPNPKDFEHYTHKVTKDLAELRKSHCADAVIGPNVCANDPAHTFWGSTWRHMMLAKRLSDEAKGAGIKLIWKDFPGKCFDDMAKHWEPIAKHPKQALALSENHTSDDIAILRSAFGFEGELYLMPQKPGKP